MPCVGCPKRSSAGANRIRSVATRQVAASSRANPLDCRIVHPATRPAVSTSSRNATRPSSPTNRDAVFEGVRDRGYAYCFSGGKIDHKCALEQDEAVRFAVSALVIARDQQRMPNKDSLGLKEHWVATNPEIVPRVLNECWALYREHGAEDARLLSICLGNLTDASPLVPLPVP